MGLTAPPQKVALRIKEVMPVMCLVHGDIGIVWAVRWAGLRPPLLSAPLLPLPNCLYILRPFLEGGVATKEWGEGVVYTPRGIVCVPCRSWCGSTLAYVRAFPPSVSSVGPTRRHCGVCIPPSIYPIVYDRVPPPPLV